MVTSVEGTVARPRRGVDYGRAWANQYIGVAQKRDVRLSDNVWRIRYNNPDLSSASDQGFEPGVALKIPPPPGIHFCKPAPVLGVVGEIPLQEIDRLFLVTQLGADKGLVSHQLTAGIDRSVCARANQD